MRKFLMILNLNRAQRGKVPLLIIGLALALATFSCDEPQDDPANHTATRTLAHGVGTVTVKGYNMTNAQWDGVADKVKDKIDATIGAQMEEHGNDLVVNTYKGVFDRGVVYNIELNPVGYTVCKTTGDGKTAYVAFDKVDTDDNWALNTLTSIINNGTILGKAGKVQGDYMAMGTHSAKHSNRLVSLGDMVRYYRPVFTYTNLSSCSSSCGSCYKVQHWG
jgi:hypothetical protein